MNELRKSVEMAVLDAAEKKGPSAENLLAGLSKRIDPTVSLSCAQVWSSMETSYLHNLTSVFKELRHETDLFLWYNSNLKKNFESVLLLADPRLSLIESYKEEYSAIDVTSMFCISFSTLICVDQVN